MTDTSPLSATDRAKRVKLMIFDVDGVLTDGGLRYGPDGERIKTFNVLDGHGIKLLQQSGVMTAIISARQSLIVSRRAADLGISVLLQGEISMLNATGGVTRLKAPCTFASPAGVRKLGIAHTDVVWTTVHSLAECEIENPATATNEELEGFLVVDSPEDFMKFIEQRKLIGGGQ